VPDDAYDPVRDGWPICVGRSVRGTFVDQSRVFLNQVERQLRGRPVKDKSNVPIWLPTVNRRREDGLIHKSNEDVEQITMFVVDSDTGVDLNTLKRLGENDQYSLLRFGHTSHSSTADKIKARIIFPLLEPVPARRWEIFWASATRWVQTFGVENDKSTRNPARVWFAPAFEPGREDDYDWWFRYGREAPAGARTCSGGQALVKYPLLDPAWVIRTFPAPPAPPPKPKPQRFMAPAQAGNPVDRARASAERLLAHRVDALLSVPQGGGQSDYVYVTGRKIGQAYNMGLIFNPDQWIRQIVESAMAVGLSESRAVDSARRGFNKGQAELWEELLDG
jgi:hypothetical protein